LLYIHTAMSYFKPMPPKLGGCWTCTHWHGETTDEVVAQIGPTV